ncbi:MAG: hypothetical protein PHW53_02185 [Patescibacteria group bacterium]|nr:hypothetical protein [Patescibacteria group bacterium]
MGRERMITPREIYTGRQYEADYFGAIDLNDEKLHEEIAKRKQPSKNPKFEYFMTFRDALEVAKKFQPIDKSDPERHRVDPANPRAPLLRDLKESLIDLMNLGEKDADKLKLYTAVNSPLDWLHGTDAFVDYDGRIITLDLTLKPSAEGKKADVVITGELPAPDDPAEEDKYLERVGQIAFEIKSVMDLKRKPGRPQIQRLYPPSEVA